MQWVLFWKLDKELLINLAMITYFPLQLFLLVLEALAVDVGCGQLIEIDVCLCCDHQPQWCPVDHTIIHMTLEAVIFTEWAFIIVAVLAFALVKRYQLWRECDQMIGKSHCHPLSNKLLPSISYHFYLER